jgi:pectate lyase
MKNELQSIIQGKSQTSHGTLIQTIASYLGRSQETSTLVKGTKQFKSEETKDLRYYIKKMNNIKFNVLQSWKTFLGGCRWQCFTNFRSKLSI